ASDPLAGEPLGLLIQKSRFGQPATATLSPRRVQKLHAAGEMKPVPGFTASVGGDFASASEMEPVVVSSANLYSFRLPSQRGLPLPSGRNMPMYTWFRNVPWLFTDTGSDADTNTLFTAWTSFTISRMHL